MGSKQNGAKSQAKQGLQKQECFNSTGLNTWNANMAKLKLSHD